ncbi:pilus biosynthesis protein TadE [Mycobacterium sp. ENV421]|uniref:TadE family type IV pilus minor pilin n=1 Tax=unclassified Mycobacterium TaxID=2642494 RepID=UPI000C9C491B|nr:TadE family type IV pilus minor pilin [Mycobacterium sp. ENV421]PND54104.1 pilus biosynthesis protein TadE [Mycobacterium sp. ENV421]
MAIAALVVVLVVCAGGITAVAMQVRCIDAAREAARLAARGDEAGADTAARWVGPAGATVRIRHDGGFVVATVTGRSRLLPGVVITADAVAATEPGA